MEYTDILTTIGGLALFLYGMRLMGEGLERAAGSKLKLILEKLTRNPFMGMVVGLVLTVIIQSSSATTVMVVGFVGAGLMDLSQACGVIMGANIGTTVTGQIIALNITEFAPVFAVVGLVLLMFSKRKSLIHIGEVLTGLGILFIGLNLMKDGLGTLKDAQAFKDVLVAFGDKPLLGFAIGLGITVIIQSSSAAIGILQTIAMQGLILLPAAMPIVFGMNLGTCITAWLASLASNRDAKRAAIIHVLFNVFSTIMFILVMAFLPFTEWIESLTPGVAVSQIANANTIYKTIATLALLPFTRYLVKLACAIIPGRDKENDGTELALEHIPNIRVGSTAISLTQIQLEIDRMFNLASKNMHVALDAFFDKKLDDLTDLYKREETIDFLNRAITQCIVELNASELPSSDARHVSKLFHVLSDIERIGDHAENIAEYTYRRTERNAHFSEDAKKELQTIASLVYQIVEGSYAFFNGTSDTETIDSLNAIEQKIDDLTEQYRDNHIMRMSRHECNADIGAIFVETLTDLERVADHALNIAQAKLRIPTPDED